MKHIKKYEKFNQELIDGLMDKGWDNLTDKEKKYIKNPDKVDLENKVEKTEKEENVKSEDPEKFGNLMNTWNTWKEMSDKQEKEGKEIWDKNTTKNLKPIDIKDCPVCFDWIQLYDFIELNYEDFDKMQIVDIIAEILDAKIVWIGKKGDLDDLDFRHISREYERNSSTWFNYNYVEKITTNVKFNDAEKFWIPKIFSAFPHLNNIRIEDYENNKTKNQ